MSSAKPARKKPNWVRICEEALLGVSLLCGTGMLGLWGINQMGISWVERLMPLMGQEPAAVKAQLGAADVVIRQADSAKTINDRLDPRAPKTDEGEVWIYYKWPDLIHVYIDEEGKMTNVWIGST